MDKIEKIAEENFRVYADVLEKEGHEIKADQLLIAIDRELREISNRLEQQVRQESEVKRTVKIAEDTLVLKRIDVTHRDADKLCDGCLFRKRMPHGYKCYLDAEDIKITELECTKPIDDSIIILNRNYIWEIIGSNFSA